MNYPSNYEVRGSFSKKVLFGKQNTDKVVAQKEGHLQNHLGKQWLFCCQFFLQNPQLTTKSKRLN